MRAARLGVRMDSLLLSCRTLSFLIACRFIPALGLSHLAPSLHSEFAAGLCLEAQALTVVRSAPEFARMISATLRNVSLGQPVAFSTISGV